jgi:hypothetical protein
MEGEFRIGSRIRQVSDLYRKVSDFSRLYRVCRCRQHVRKCGGSVDGFKVPRLTQKVIAAVLQCRLRQTTFLISLVAR